VKPDQFFARHLTIAENNDNNSQGTIRTLFGEFNSKYITNCQRNIYSDDDEVDSDTNTDQHPNLIIPKKKYRLDHIEDLMKNDENNFPSINFVNEGKDDVLFHKAAEEDIAEKKKNVSEELFKILLHQDTVKPSKYAEVNMSYLNKEDYHFQTKHKEFISSTKSSFMHKKCPFRELPDIDGGNYSMCLFNREAADVNDWIKQDLRSEKIAMNELKDDIKKFSEYDTFNVSYVNQIKYRNEINFVVEHKYNPINVEVCNIE
jgi:hypothetical protein